MEWMLWIGLLLLVGFYPVQYATVSQWIANMVINLFSIGMKWQLVIRPLTTYMGFVVIYMGIKLLLGILFFRGGKRVVVVQAPAPKTGK